MSILLANLSSDEEFLYILLGVDNWKVNKQPDKELSDIEDMVVDENGRMP